MDKNAIKKYAIWARRELIERVSQRAMIYGISTEEAGDPNVDSVNGHLLSAVEKRQRQALIHNINEKGYEQVMEEVAYTWFNRFAALRFMEVNGYLPSHIRVFTNDAGEFKPQILAESIHMELEGLDIEKVYELESTNKSEELFKYLLIVQCNALNSILPGMFQPIEDYTELLFPDYLLRDGSIVEQMVSTIPEEDWTDQVQIIGWLYQYYNTEPKDRVFAELKKNSKIAKEKIPAATQLFTPDWIVHYMVENSLGRLWLEGHSNDALKSEWKYYLDEAEQETQVQEQLTVIRKDYAELKPEEIRVIDPCMGSGHILCVLFDVLVHIYEDYGYTAREAAVKIIENNLWGLDIDERASQLSYFAVMMKARQYDRRFFTRKVQPHVYAIVESNGIDSVPMHDMGIDLSQDEYAKAVKQALTLIEEMYDAKEYGSAIRVTPCDWALLRRFAVPRWEYEGNQIPMNIHGEIELASKLQEIINVGEVLSQKYHVVVTNPPYMGSSSMGPRLKKYVNKNYPDSKSDLFAVFIERCRHFTGQNGYQAMLTQHSWMFLSSYERLRKKLDTLNIVNMAHLGPRAFDEIGGEVVQTTSFVLRHLKNDRYIGTYLRLVDPTSQIGKETMFLTGANRYYVQKKKLECIPGAPIAYWVSDQLVKDFSNGVPFSEVGFPKVGMQTSNNDKYLRFWYEIRADELFANTKKWIKYIKGGQFRRWYGNLEYVVWYNSSPEFILQQKNARVLPESELNLLKCTWTDLATSQFSSRLAPIDSFHDISGHCFYPSESNQLYLLGLTNSIVFQEIIDLLNSSLHYQVGDVARVPVIIKEKELITELVQKCVNLSRTDWDSFEGSWDFQRHPLLPLIKSSSGDSEIIESIYRKWEEECNNRFMQLKTNEEKLNHLFINIYGLENELIPEIEDKAVTVRRANLNREIKSFISYAVGCMFGRYSLDANGIAYAGGLWNNAKYLTFQPDNDAIIPISDDEYFEDDIVERFIKFVEVVYGKGTLEINLQFIADALGGKGSSREVIRNYFINGFYADHLKVYQRRPIYWLFDSGKKNGFKCLIYMHRYQPDTIAKIRTDYVHEQQSRYRTAISDLEQRVQNATGSERVKLSKQLAKLQGQAEEVRVYEETIHHLADQMIEIDLDDGVKHNYALFKDVLAKIK